MTPSRIERAAIRLVEVQAEHRAAAKALGLANQTGERLDEAITRRRAAGYRRAGAFRALTFAVKAGRAGATLVVCASGAPLEAHETPERSGGHSDAKTGGE